jgi:hypothetical protein
VPDEKVSPLSLFFSIARSAEVARRLKAALLRIVRDRVTTRRGRLNPERVERRS